MLHAEIAAARRESRPLTLMLCDLDHFKHFNDTYGHVQGDECLKQVGRLLREVCVRPRDIAARYGGEEFALILPNTPRSGSMTFARALGQMLKFLKIRPPGTAEDIPLTLSGGITTCIPDEHTSAESMLMRADEALYAAKTQGRNRAETDLAVRQAALRHCLPIRHLSAPLSRDARIGALSCQPFWADLCRFSRVTGYASSSNAPARLDAGLA